MITVMHLPIKLKLDYCSSLSICRLLAELLCHYSESSRVMSHGSELLFRLSVLGVLLLRTSCLL